MLDANEYFQEFSQLLRASDAEKKLAELYIVLEKARRDGKRIFFAGNGASSAISSHCALDFTKQGGLVSYTATDAALVSAYANDYGYENALTKIFESYRFNTDIVILVSTSGKSKNILLLAERARALGHTVVSFTGHDKSNPLAMASDISLWVDSYAYNIVENIHMTWLGLLIDSLVGDSVYDVT